MKTGKNFIHIWVKRNMNIEWRNSARKLGHPRASDDYHIIQTIGAMSN